MSNNLQDTKGLIKLDIDDNQILTIDPNNVFWAILRKKQYTDSLSVQKVLSLYNRLKSKLDLQMREFRFNSDLAAVYIDPIDKCNANCPYCYIPSRIRKRDTKMDKEQLEYVLKKIGNYFKKKKTNIKPVIVFHASEPLLVKDIIFDAISNFHRQFNFGIQTNALLLEKSDADFIKKYKVGIGISLDSFDHQINDKLRPGEKGNGNFYKAQEAFEWFDGYEGLNVITTITKFNVNHLPKLVKFLHSKKVGCVLLNPVRLTSKASRSLSPDQKVLSLYFIEAIEKAIKLSKTSKHQIIVGNFVNIILGIIAPTARRLMCDISPCGAGRCFLTITASGNMIPCGEFIGLDGFSGGNIFNTTISNAMVSNPFKKIRARIVEGIDECSVCDFRNICGAPCPAELYSLRHNMYQPSVFCEFYKEIIRYAFKLIAEDKVGYLLRNESLKSLECEYNLGGKTWIRLKRQ